MSNIYISTPNPVILCFDTAQDYIRQGRLYHPYTKESIVFECVEQILPVMDNLYDALRFPFAATTDRTFLPQKEVVPVWMKEQKQLTRQKTNEELLEQRGSIATFLVQVQHRENTRWVGRVVHLENELSKNFRSIIELLNFVEDELHMKNKKF